MTASPDALFGIALVADGDVDRGKAIAEACAGLGLSTRFAAHGAEALEAALAEPPDVVVAALGLPLIDAQRLASILRANPRTLAARIVILGDAQGETAAPGAVDARLPRSADPEVVVREIARLLGSGATSEQSDPAASTGESELEGKLTQLAMIDLLQLFHMNRKTGTVELVRRGRDGGEERGCIVVSDGNVVDAHCGAVDGEKAFHRLLAWGTGSFRFVRTRPHGAGTIRMATRALLLEGVRQLDELGRVRSELPALDAQVSLSASRAELPAVVQPLTREVLELLETFSSVGDVLDRSRHPDYQVLRTLQMLADRGIVEIVQYAGERRADAGDALFSEDQQARLRRWATRAGAAAYDVRLVVAASDPEATRGLLRQLDGLPGARIDRAFRDGRFSRSTLRRIGRIGPEDDIGIELVHLPTHPRCEPLWPLVAATAQAALLVLGAPSRDDVRALRGLRRLLAEDARIPIHSVLVEDTAVRTSPADDGFRGAEVVRIAAEGSSESRAALARLLAGLVP